MYPMLIFQFISLLQESGRKTPVLALERNIIQPLKPHKSDILQILFLKHFFYVYYSILTLLYIKH